MGVICRLKEADANSPPSQVAALERHIVDVALTAPITPHHPLQAALEARSNSKDAKIAQLEQQLTNLNSRLANNLQHAFVHTARAHVGNVQHAQGGAEGASASSSYNSNNTSHAYLPGWR